MHCSLTSMAKNKEGKKASILLKIIYLWRGTSSKANSNRRRIETTSSFGFWSPANVLRKPIPIEEGLKP